MKLSHSVQLDLEAFLLRGRFDHLRLGQTPEWLAANFPAPDGWSSDHERDLAPIWRYGNLELHFREGHLVRIFCDYPGEIDGGEKVSVAPWILDEPGGLALGFMLDELLRRNVAYAVRPIEALGSVDVALEASGARLRYSNETGELPPDPRALPLGAFWLEAPF